MSTNQIVIIDNVAVLILVCLVSLSGCALSNRAGQRVGGPSADRTENRQFVSWTGAASRVDQPKVPKIVSEQLSRTDSGAAVLDQPNRTNRTSSTALRQTKRPTNETKDDQLNESFRKITHFLDDQLDRTLDRRLDGKPNSQNLFSAIDHVRLDSTLTSKPNDDETNGRSPIESEIKNKIKNEIDKNKSTINRHLTASSHSPNASSGHPSSASPAGSPVNLSNSSSHSPPTVRHSAPRQLSANPQRHSSSDYNRAKRSTTANYRLNSKTASNKFRSYHIPSTTSSAKISSSLSNSAHRHNHDHSQIVLSQASLSNNLNDAEIAYSAVTSEFGEPISYQFGDKQTTASLPADSFENSLTNSLSTNDLSGLSTNSLIFNSLTTNSLSLNSPTKQSNSLTSSPLPSYALSTNSLSSTESLPSDSFHSSDFYSADFRPSKDHLSTPSFQPTAGQSNGLTPNISKTFKPDISNTLTPSINPFTSSLPTHQYRAKVYSSYPDNGFYTSKSFELYGKLYADKRMTSRFESTATSLLPLLLFDQHQLAQEEALANFSQTAKYNHPSTASPEFSSRSSSHSNHQTGHHLLNSPSTSYTSTSFTTSPAHFESPYDAHNLHHSKTRADLSLQGARSAKYLTKTGQVSTVAVRQKNENDFGHLKSGLEFNQSEQSENKDESRDIKLPAPVNAAWPIPNAVVPNQSNDSSVKNDQYDSQLNVMMNDEADELLAAEDRFDHENRRQKNNREINGKLRRSGKTSLPTTARIDLFDEAQVKWFTEVIRIQPSNFQTDRHHHPKVGLLSASIFRTNTSKSNHSFEGILPTYNGILSPGVQNLAIIFLGLLIVITIIGNTLVCLSPIYFRKLRHPSNYLLISLALSDLGVAVLVMPIALYKELQPVWSLGILICDIWLGLDIVFCTASILHLCVICIDRYLTITRPFTYAVRRKSSRSLFLISIVWLLAIGICLPPLLVLGNEHGTDVDPICTYCNKFGYQLYATLGAFYIPLLVMLILYYKIYEAAKKVIEAEHKSQCNSVVQISSASTTKTDKAYSPSYIRQTISCPAHPNTSLTPEPQFANNLGKQRKSIDLQLDQHRLLLKPSNTLEKSSSTNCTSCGRSLEKEQQQTITGENRNVTGGANKTKRKTGPLSDSQLNERTNGVAIDRDSILKSNDKKSADKNGSKTCEPNKSRPQKIKHRKCLFAIRRSKPNDACESGDKSEESGDADGKVKKSKKLKKKSRTPEAGEQRTSNQPLLDSTRRKEGERNNNLNNNLNNLEYIDQIERTSLCEQCLSNLINNNNDEPDDEPAFALACDPDHSTDPLARSPSSLNCRPDYGPDFKSDYRSSSSASSKDRRPSSDQRLKNRTINLNIAAQQMGPPAPRKSTQSSLRERKASITLGVIMCAFIFCWLPFFILALIRPFASDLIPDWASSLTLWLGYVNSGLNPVIYVTFHQDFRRAFKYLVLCRCKVMKSSMRKEAYNVQFG